MIDGEISITILVFILDYFQKKPITSFFKISKKKSILGPFWAIFAKIWGKINFPGKRALSAFKYSNYLPWRKKSEKIPIPEKNYELLMDRHTNKEQSVTLIEWEKIIVN